MANHAHLTVCLVPQQLSARSLGLCSTQVLLATRYKMYPSPLLALTLALALACHITSPRSHFLGSFPKADGIPIRSHKPDGRMHHDKKLEIRRQPVAGLPVPASRLSSNVGDARPTYVYLCDTCCALLESNPGPCRYQLPVCWVQSSGLAVCIFALWETHCTVCLSRVPALVDWVNGRLRETQKSIAPIYMP